MMHDPFRDFNYSLATGEELSIDDLFNKVGKTVNLIEENHNKDRVKRYKIFTNGPWITKENARKILENKFNEKYPEGIPCTRPGYLFV